MQHREFERGVTALLANRRQYANPAELEFKDRFGHVPATIAHFDSVQSLAVNLCYLVGNGVLAVARETIHAGAGHSVARCRSRKAMAVLGDALRGLDSSGHLQQ